MKSNLGKAYADGELIVKEGDGGDSMYVIQEGSVEVFVHRDGRDIVLAVRKAGDFFGEMAIFEREARSASVRAVGPARILSVDRRQLISRIQEDPSLAYRVIQSMSKRIRDLSEEMARIKSARA